MKLRIRGNSIRLRLLRGEVAEFAADGYCRETISFGASSLAYVLRKADKAEALSADFADNEITVHVPVTVADHWTGSEEVSLCGEQNLVNGEILKILVEKDFVCLNRYDDEDNRDAYPNTSHKC